MPIGKTENSHTPILPEQTDSINSKDILLSELSPQDKPWDKHRGFADTIQSHYNGSKFDRYAQRVSFCSQLLEFGLTPGDDETIRLKLRSAKFCRVRHCPVC
jgi:hypothetical protein